MSGVCDEGAVARIRGLNIFVVVLSWGSASLHPRLYAVTCFAGLVRDYPLIQFNKGLASWYPLPLARIDVLLKSQEGVAMFEFGLGVILAALFVAAYVIITTFLRRDKHELGGQYPQVTLNPLDSTHSIGSGKSRQALTSGDAGERHSGGAKHGSGEDRDSK